MDAHSLTSLAGHLRGLSREQLTALVATRRDATVEPAPTTMDQVAERLLHPRSMAAACTLLTRPQLQVGEAAAALGDGCDPARLAALLGVPEDDPDLAAALRFLTDLALVWPRTTGLATGHLTEIWPNPLGLGPGVADLLATRNTDQLRALAKLHGVPQNGRGRDELVVALAGWLAGAENVRRLAAEAPVDVRSRLDRLARQSGSPFDRSPGIAPAWAVERGLLGRSEWGGAEMPREVALALREDFRAPFQPRPPDLPLTPISPETAEREASAAAAETLASITAVVEAMSSDPVPLLKTGGLGVRELRRITKVAGQDEDRTRLTIELLAAGGLIEASATGLTPSVAYDAFAAMEPADQLLDAVRDWLSMPASPLGPADPTAASAGILFWDEEEEALLTGLRILTLRTLLGATPKAQTADPRQTTDPRQTADPRQTTDPRQTADPGPLAARVGWTGPLLADRADDDLDRYVTGIWREAHRLGLLAHGTVTALGRSLLTGDPAAARARAEAILPRPRHTVLLQNDLTAVVTGTPSAGLLALLDSAAAPESRTGAWTWRFSSASVRAALDAGNTPESLIARITEVAEGGRVPQTLTYLIDDLARRHGRVQVRPAGCCLCSDDEVLLAEILHTRALRALSLVRLAPTVLVSGKPQAETLAALRKAGFVPAGLRADGTPAIEIPRRRRTAALPTEADADIAELSLADPAELARNLLGDH